MSAFSDNLGILVGPRETSNRTLEAARTYGENERLRAKVLASLFRDIRQLPSRSYLGSIADQALSLFPERLCARHAPP
jgi:hypothetical protein